MRTRARIPQADCTGTWLCPLVRMNSLGRLHYILCARILQANCTAFACIHVFFPCVLTHVCVKMKPKPRLENCCVPNCKNRTARVFKFPRDQGWYFISSIICKKRIGAKILRHKVKDKNRKRKNLKRKKKCVKNAMNDNFFLQIE